MNTFKPTELRISTMTITANFSQQVCLQIVGSKLQLVDYYSNKEGCIKIEPPGINSISRGYCKKDEDNKPKKKKNLL